MLTTFQSPFGDRFKWNKLPFGLSVLSEIFQRHIHGALAGLAGVYCIADDIIIAGVGDATAEATESHDQRLSAFLQRCQEKGIVLNARKFQLHSPRMSFIGYILTPEGIQPDDSKVKAITKMPVPTDVSGVKRLLGMVQFLARFVPHLSETLHPIQTLVNKEHSWHWGPEQDSAFAKVKDALSAEPVLKHYNPKLPLVVQADASKNALGAAMLQEGHPLAYASRSLTSSEQNYCQMEKELLSVQFAMEKFHQYTWAPRHCPK